MNKQLKEPTNAPGDYSNWYRSFHIFIDSSLSVAKKILFLEIEMEKKQARAFVEAGIPMKGERLWFLMASCIIASIGLNTNSSAVVIGAMLISPLMGPILGLGFGMAAASRRLIRLSIANLAFAVLVTLIFASLFFVISPFQDPTSEILARSAPNLLDLMVAIAAAFAGVVAMNSTSLAGAVPGVAIATAIMPPLCASAYGIAHLNWKIAFGAFYLFFVNAFAIALVAYLLFRRMHLSASSLESESNERYKPAFIALVLILIVGPLSWSLWDSWKANFTRRSLARLVETYRSELDIVSWQWDGTEEKKLSVFAFRKAPAETVNKIKDALTSISPETTLDLHESTLPPEVAELASNMKSSQLSELVRNPKVIEGLLKLASGSEVTADLMSKMVETENEFRVLLGNCCSVQGYIRAEKGNTDVLYLVNVKIKKDRQYLERESQRYRDWLQGKFSNTTHLILEIH